MGRDGLDDDELSKQFVQPVSARHGVMVAPGLRE